MIALSNCDADDTLLANLGRFIPHPSSEINGGRSDHVHFSPESDPDGPSATSARPPYSHTCRLVLMLVLTRAASLSCTQQHTSSCGRPLGGMRSILFFLSSFPRWQNPYACTYRHGGREGLHHPATPSCTCLFPDLSLSLSL